MDAKDLRELDELVQDGSGASRSEPVQDTSHGELRRFKRVSLAEECAKLDPEAERAEAERWLHGEATLLDY
jgi:hypothetical protein